MKKLMLSIFTLLLFAAATTTTAVAQESKPQLAVLVVGMDDWMLGDVLAHLVGEELNRGKAYEVVTRRNDVQNKLESLRRGHNRLDEYLLRTWATEHGISNLCVVRPASGFNFSLKLLDVSSGDVLCSGSRVDLNAVALKQLAWSLTGSIGDGCPSFEPCPARSTCLGNYIEASIGLEMVCVEGGAFVMGCLPGRDDINGHTCDNAEKPFHPVTLESFWIGKYEVTLGQWEAVMESTTCNIGCTSTKSNVSWEDAKAFCDTLSARTGKSYRLPTEEEWEYAARGGKSSAGYVYSGGNSIGSVAWYEGNDFSSLSVLLGNELGIHNMSGSVWEWCSNKWRADYNSSEDGSARVLRGGSMDNIAWACRVAFRNNLGPSARFGNVGFRVV
jgi:formylglycine-generating enzyme required for sulfatase activity